VQRLVEDGQIGATSIHRLQKRLRRALMISQLGITLALVSLGWVGSGVNFRISLNEGQSNKLWGILIFLFIVLLSTIVSGVLPKALVLNRPEAAALRLAPLLEAVMRTLAPILSLLESFASLLLRLVGLNAKWDSLVPALSADELETLIETGGVTGLDPDEQNILEGVFALRDTQVREVMVPRSGMVTLPIEVKFSDLMKAVHKTRHARFLVIGDSLDDVRGVIDLRELAKEISEGRMSPNTELKPFLLPAKMVLETSTLSELLPIIRKGNPILVVVDEHGGTEGLVTAADLTGEIVGDEIQNGIETPELEKLDNQPKTWIASGDLEIIELNRQLNLELPESDDHHTIAGFLLEILQHIPSVGETLIHEGIKFEICSMKGPRIARVKLNLSSINFEEN
tara:strand:- start:1763 stop:2956 length:1194 start_codon:yes stop_codon:yes gene_type:complete